MNKIRKETGEPGKIYHVRNIIGRENLITSGRMNELAHALWTEYTCLVAKALWLTEGARRHYTKLPGSTASYGDSTQTSTFENHANLLGKLTTIRPEEWLSRYY